MNERIKKLMAQTLDSKFSHTWTTMTYHDMEKFAEHFSQLIVQECCSVVKPSAQYPTESVDIVEEFHRGYWVGCNDSTYRIKDHFGVEE